MGGVQPTICYCAGQGVLYLPPLASRQCIIGALWSCCHGDVGQSADVRAPRGFGAGSRVQTAQAGADSKLWLNLGHRDSPEQRQAEAELCTSYREGMRGCGRRGGGGGGGEVARAGEYQITCNGLK